MLRNFLYQLGLMPRLPNVGGGSFGPNGGEPETDGAATITFEEGRKVALTEDEEDQDDRRKRITDRDLVWPGKTETLQIANSEPVALRFALTVTDLPPGFYAQRPPTGGTATAGGGILLQPGEEASFEVVFTPPPGGEKTRTQTFSFVLTCFDPRRANDPGEIVQELALRWVPLPSRADLVLTATPDSVVLRPWRRTAPFELRFANKSFLPPSVALQIVRASTKDALKSHAEPVGTLTQELPARTPGTWHCVLPPAAQRSSYFATATGSAQVAAHAGTPLALPKPVFVRYVPWLRMGRDWLFLFGLIFFLIWATIGIPIRKRPVVRVALAFAGLEKGQLPPDSRLSDLASTLILLDSQGRPLDGQSTRTGIAQNGELEFAGPTGWYGYRWPFGWSGWHGKPQKFTVTLAPKNGMESAFGRYDLNGLKPDGTPAYSIRKATQMTGDWTTQTIFEVPATRGVLVSVRFADLGALAGKNLRQMSVTYSLDGVDAPPKNFALLRDPVSGKIRPLTLDLTQSVKPGTSAIFSISAQADGVRSYDVSALEVRRQDRPFQVNLTFPRTIARSPNPNSSNSNSPGSGSSNANSSPPGIDPAVAQAAAQAKIEADEKAAQSAKALALAQAQLQEANQRAARAKADAARARALAAKPPASPDDAQTNQQAAQDAQKNADAQSAAAAAALVRRDAQAQADAKKQADVQKQNEIVRQFEQTRQREAARQKEQARQQGLQDAARKAAALQAAVPPSSSNSDAPAPPTGLAVNSDALGQVKVQWTAMPDVERYVIYRSITRHDGSVTALKPYAKTFGAGFTDTKVSPGIVYTYGVRAVGGGGYSLMSRTVLIRTRIRRR